MFYLDFLGLEDTLLGLDVDLVLVLFGDVDVVLALDLGGVLDFDVLFGDDADEGGREVDLAVVGHGEAGA